MGGNSVYWTECRFIDTISNVDNNNLNVAINAKCNGRIPNIDIEPYILRV